MVSKNNVQIKDRYSTKQVPHYGIRKLSVGVASVLLGTTFYMGMNGNVVHADTVNGQDNEASVTPDSQVVGNDQVSTDSFVANSALSNSQAVVQAAETVIKSDVATAPKVTSIENSAVQSQASQANTSAASDSAVSSNSVSENVSSSVATQTFNIQSAAIQAQPAVSDVLNANLMESTADTVMERAVQQTSTLRDDRSTDYSGYIKGQAQSVTLKDGSSLSVNSDVVNSDTDTSAILTFKSSSFKPGDTYTILIPRIMMNKDSDVARLQPSFGTTTVETIQSSANDGKYYWKIVDHFVGSGTISQTIKLSRTSDFYRRYLKDYFSDSDFWRPYDLIHGNINLIKGTDSGSLDFKYQLGGFTKYNFPRYNLANGDFKYPLVNGQAYDFNVYLNTNSVIENGNYDGFGLGKDVLENASLSIRNDHDYLKLNNSFANIYNDHHQLIGTMRGEADHGKLIFSDLKLSDTVPAVGSVVSLTGVNSFYITFNATVNIPKQLFNNGKTFVFNSDVDDFSFTFSNPKVGSVKPGDPRAAIQVLPALNSLSTGDLIAYQQSHDFMDLGASFYFDGNKCINKRTIGHSDIPGARRDIGFDVPRMKLAVNGMTLSDLDYHLDIPDGLDLYSVNFDAFDHITSVIIRLKDGTSYKISSDDLRSHYDPGSLGSKVAVKRGWSIYNDKYLGLDSNSSIASVDIKYHDIDSSFYLGPTRFTDTNQYYRVAPTYASGKPVQVGDLLKFTATLSSTDPNVKIDSTPLLLDDVLVTDPNDDTLGVFHAIQSGQSSKTPGVVNAGTLNYEDCNSDNGFPHLKHAVAYLQIPDNASLTDINKIVVNSGLNNVYGALTPKSISLVKVVNGVTFIKIDLSNYNDIRGGVNASVPYGNVGDLQTSSRPSTMLVVSDNFNENINGIQHFSSDNDSRTDEAVKALIKQENIDVDKTDYQNSSDGYTGWWDILTSDGVTSATMANGNENANPSLDSKQNDHGQQADLFDLYGTIIDATDQSMPGAIQIINIPDTSDSHSQFNPQLTGPIHVIDANTGKNLDDVAHVTYSQSPATLRADSLTSLANEIRLTADQVTDWSKIKSIEVRMDVPKRTSARAVLSMKDPQIYDHVGKTVYVANAIFSTQADSPASEYHLKPVVINAGDPASAKLTVVGQSTVKTVVHYKDAQGDHCVELPDKAQTYTELQDVMNRSDFLQSDSDLTAGDRALLPAGMVLDYAHPTIKNSNETYLNNYQNGTAAFGQQVKYDFDQDQVIFEGAMPTQTSDTKTVTETIYYVYANGPKAGQKAADDVTKSVEFNRTGFKNPFTGEVQWMKATDSKTFDAVKSPEIKGYQVDQSEIGAQIVTQDSDNIEKTVKYKSLTQKVTVNYVDDTTGQTLKTDNLTGRSGESSNYSTKNQIDVYTSQHYQLVSDDTNGEAPVYDDNADTDQVYDVHLKHEMQSVNDQVVINEIVHYVAADNSTVPADHTAIVEFTRAGTTDLVTNQTNWNAWSDGGQLTFDAVSTPKKIGYTPDLQTVSAKTVGPTDGDIKVTVTYTPDQQNLDVKFIDDSDNGKVLKTITKSGGTNTDAGYNTKSDIQDFEGQHYVLVSDSSNGQALKFDDQTGIDQHYEVHLKHGIHKINEQETVNETVHYKMSDGTRSPEDHTVKVDFARDGYHDEVTDEDYWNAWMPGGEQTFDKVQSPVVSGYTPDVDQITAQTVKPTDNDFEYTVTYSPNIQLAYVKYIDDTDNKVLAQDDLSGRTNETSGYRTADRITEFENQHYVFVSDNYPVNGMMFDNNDNVDQIYEVHFKHGTRIDEQDVRVPRTIKYVYQDGKQAQPDHNDVLSYHETKVVDLVDGHTVSDDWTKPQDFTTIVTPAIEGYTSDRVQVANKNIAYNHSAITEKVTYNPDAQQAVVKYIDDTTGEQLFAQDLKGYSDQSTGYNTKKSIDDYVGQHYVLVSDETKGETIVFDHDDSQDQSYEVHLKHGTKPANESRTKKIIVHYQYADGLARSGKAADDQTVNDLTFNRTGTHDLVTNKVAWNAWDQSSQIFAEIDSPVIDGYTPDQVKISNVKVTADSPEMMEKTVVYNADAQKLSVEFIDDVTGQTLKTINRTGYSDESADYNTKSDIQDFEGQHYVLVSDQTNGENLVFDHDDKVVQRYEVHLMHHLTPISDSRTVNETIHYQYADGAARSGKAADDFNAKALIFNRTGNHDDVANTGLWNAWTPSDQQTFAKVESPLIEGYTPDQAQIDAINVNSDSQNIEETVVYLPDAQKLTVDFIDDTTGQTLKTVEKDGRSDESAGYNTKSDIQHYIGLHYNLVSDGTNGDDLAFDHDNSVDQHYEVHFVHAMEPVSEATSTNETVHYQLANGNKAFNDYTDQVSFSRDGFKDLVTDVDHWNAWTPDAHQTFREVQSPVKQGYTPDKALVDAITVEPHDQNIEQTVIYSPDAQRMTVNYIDDVTGRTLETKSFDGVSDQAIDYNTKSMIDHYAGQHYKLVSDNTNGGNLVFDHDDTNDQVYNVHLTHTYQPVSEEHQVHETVHYQYSDGRQAEPDYQANALTFTRTGSQDLVTKDVVWNAWTVDQVFSKVQSPSINGYTPDIETVPATTVSYDSNDVDRTVTYYADDQTILVNYIDDDTQSTLKTDSIIGKTAQQSGYTTKKSLDDYQSQGYDVVSDGTKGNDLVFDSDSTEVQVYDVYLNHRHQAVRDSDTVNQVIHYVYTNGSKAADDHQSQPVEFTRTGSQDLVTKNIVWNAWTPASQTFSAVASPVITGYTPSRASVDHIDVHPGDKDIDETITYAPDVQTIVVNYIDQLTGQTLKTDTVNGYSDQMSVYNTESTIEKYQNQHYNLAKDETAGKTLMFDHDDSKTQVFNVYLGHDTEAASRSHQVYETISYKYADGTQAEPDYQAPVKTFKQTGVKDLVTDQINWSGAWTKDQQFSSVKSPVIIGFTANVNEVPAIMVGHDSNDVKKLVVYTANNQTAKINYIDDTTGKVLEVDNANGKFGQVINFEYDVNGQIQQFVGQHYKLVSNDFNGQKYQADNTKNYYEVHLAHQHRNVQDTDTVVEIVEYQFEDGCQAQPTVTQKVNFIRDGVKDLVTGTIAWMPVDSQGFAAVATPTMTGYTPDVDKVDGQTVKFGDADIERTVTYYANAQTANLKIVDDTLNKTLKDSTANGQFDQVIDFDFDPAEEVLSLQGQGYVLVSDNFKPGVKYQADNNKNQFEIHVIHGHGNVTRDDTITETIHYVNEQDTRMHDDNVQTLTFKQAGTKDLVTGQISWQSVDSQDFNAVDSPVITGYTPDLKQVGKQTVTFGDADIVKTVTYVANNQEAGIKFVDDTLNKTMFDDQVNGKFDYEIVFGQNILNLIQSFKNKGYELVSDDFDGNVQHYQVDNSKNQFEVHFKHGAMPVTDTDTVTETIHYLGPDGNKLAPDKTQTITLTRHGMKDTVTGQIDWNPVEPQEFTAVKSPVIDGYQVDVQVVAGRQVLFGDKDVVVNVHYTKLPEQKQEQGQSKQPGTNLVNTGTVTPEKVVKVTNGTVQETKQNTVKNPAQSTVQDTKQLPQTGNDKQAGLLSLIGSSLMASLAVFGLGKKKKHEN